MADMNSLALLVQPPQMDMAKTLMSVAQLRALETSNALQQFQMQAAQRRENALQEYGKTGDLNALRSVPDVFGPVVNANNAMDEGRRANTRETALTNYGKTGNVEDLRGQPDVYAQMITSRGQMDEQRRKTFDENIQVLAKDATTLMGISDVDERRTEYKRLLDERYKEGRIDKSTYDRWSKQEPTDLALSNMRKAGLTLEQQITLEQKEADRKAGAKALEGLNGVFGGGAAPAPGPRPAGPMSSTNEPKLARAESGGNPRVVNDFGYAGTYQFGAPRLAQLGIYTPGEGENLKHWSKTDAGTGNKWTGKFNVPGHPEVKTINDFLSNPDAQKAAFRVHTAKTDLEIAEGGLDRFIGQTVGGVPITQDGLRNMIHLGGVAGTKKFLESGGRENAKDANGTSLADYARMGTDTGSPRENMINFGTTIAGIPSQKLVPALVAMAGLPGIPKETRDVATELLKAGLAESKPTNDQREYLTYVQQELQAGRAPKSFFDYQVALKQAGSTKVNIGEGAKAVQKGLGERYLKAEDSATAAAGEVRMYEQIDKLLDDPNVYTGTAADQIATLKKAGQTLLGLNFKGVANAEVAKKITDEIALGYRAKAKDQNTSNYEARIYERMGAGLGDSAQGRKLLVQFRIADLRFKEEQAKVWREHLKDDGEVDPKVFEALARLEAKRREKLSDFMDAAGAVATDTNQPKPTAGAEDALEQLRKKYKDLEP